MMSTWPPATGRDLTRINEGKRFAPYYDSLGFATIGVGHLLSNEHLIPLAKFPPATDRQIEDWFAADYAAAQDHARDVVGDDAWASMSDARQAALTDMAFELGQGGLQKFQHMLDAIRAGDWEKAAAYAKDSLWDRQVPKRAMRVETLLRTGEWSSLGDLDPKFWG
jgi:lysozyme